MDTHGHEQHAKEAGIPLLKAAFERAGKHATLKELLGEDYLYAFYLGNWLTDVSQGIDPVAYAAAETKAMNAFDRFVAGVEALAKRVAHYLAGAAGLPRVVALLAKTYRPLLQNLFVVLRGGAQSDFGIALTKIMKVKGYVKFVHPDKKGGKVRLKYAIYKAIFEDPKEGRFTQYYPHEHLDRWPDALDLHGKYTDTAATRTRTPDGTGTGSVQDPYIYEYLRHDIEIAAGSIADVDLWARRALAKNNFLPGAVDEQKDWVMNLAKLGHALHACEDFFAHSNFIEHLYHGMSDSKDALNMMGIKKGVAGGDNTPWVVYNKRLNKLTGKRVKAPNPPGGTEWKPDTAWHEVGRPLRTPRDETHVVTGTFDFQDTLHSLNHVASELGAGTDSAVETAEGHVDKFHKAERFTKLLGELCRGVEDVARAKGQKSLSEAQAREYAESLLKQYARNHKDKDVREAAQIFEDIPKEATEIRGDLLTGVSKLTKYNPHRSIFSLLDGYVMFVGWTLELNVEIQKGIDEHAPWLRTIAEPLTTWIEKNISQPLGELIEDFMGRYRVGCHSLLAKDYEWKRERYQEVLDKLYWRNMNCSKAVHWYIVKTLTRWSEPPKVQSCRAEPATRRKACATVNAHRYVDWHELLEFFLRHPHGKPQPRYVGNDEKHRWWWKVVELSNWKQLPGLTSVTAAGRSPLLPHKLVLFDRGSARKNREAVEKLRDDALKMREDGEAFYNDSLKGKNRPPKPEPKETASADPLPPVKYVEGVKKRLQLLGYYDGPLEPPFEQVAREATRAFQRHQRLKPDGIPGEKTQARLLAVVGR